MYNAYKYNSYFIKKNQKYKGKSLVISLVALQIRVLVFFKDSYKTI